MRLADMFDIARRAAESESLSSQLPGRENGPADAYRHILWAAELTRRFGANFAKMPLEAKELFALLGTGEAAAMDRWNNDIGIQIGRNAKNWEDVVQAARRVIEQSPGDGTDDREDQVISARWLDESNWTKNPAGVDPISGKISRDLRTGLPIELPTNHPDVNWITGPDKKLDWEGKRVQEPFKYRFGGEDFRHKPDRSPGAMSEPMTMARNEAEAERGRRVADNAQPLGDGLLVAPGDLSFENKERVRAELGFHAEEAGGDPRKQAKLAKCMGNCFVREPGFDGLPGSLPEQLGGIAATMNSDTALAVLRGAVPEAMQTEPPRRHDQAQQRRRPTGSVPLDESGRVAVRQAVLRLGPGQVQANIARGAARKAIERVGGGRMLAKDLPGIFGAAFAPMGGGGKPLRAAAEAANAINERVAAPERADPGNATGRESATAIERAIQVAGPGRFLDAFDENLAFSPRRGRRRHTGRSLFDV